MSLNTSIRAFYRLEEVGTVAARLDHFGLGPNLSPSGGATNTTGKVGNGLLCDADASVASPSGSYFDFSGVDRTVTGWVKFNTFDLSPGVVSNWANGAGVTQWLIWHNGSRLAWRWKRPDTSENEIAANTFGALSTGVFYFFAVWHNQTSGEFGIRVNTAVDTVTDANGLISGASSIMAIGNRNTSSAGVDGVVDSVGFWDRVLSSGELDQLYNSGNGLEPPFDIGLSVDNFQLRSASWNEKKYAGCIAARSRLVSNTGYVRQTMVTKDDSSSVPVFSQRYVRNYYTVPPTNFWEQYKMRLDLSAAPSNVREDGFRYYERIYKHNQDVLVDGPVVVSETLIPPESFVHPAEPKAAETFTFSNAVNLNSLNVDFSWSPTFGNADVVVDIEIARFSIDSNNYIALSLQSGSRFEREYNEGDVYGRHDPQFRLSKVRGGSMVASVFVSAYFGYDLSETSGERSIDSLMFSVFHAANGLLGLRINRHNIVGEKVTKADVLAYSGTGIGSIIYSGIGYFGPPEIVDAITSAIGRVVPAGRVDLLRRTITRDKHSVLAGERDPTAGQLIIDTPYLSGDTFDRADNADLGSDWTILKQTGNGFNIISNKADCVQEGFEYWVRKPQHASVIINADVAVSNTNDVVGLLARLDRHRSDISAYGAEIIQTGASAASVRVVIWWLGTRTILSTGSITGYTSGTTFGLRFTLTGTTLLAEVFDKTTAALLGSATTTHDALPKPGRLGMYGQTGGAGQHVTLDNWSVSKNFLDDLS